MPCLYAPDSSSPIPSQPSASHFYISPPPQAQYLSLTAAGRDVQPLYQYSGVPQGIGNGAVTSRLQPQHSGRGVAC